MKTAGNLFLILRLLATSMFFMASFALITGCATTEQYSLPKLLPASPMTAELIIQNNPIGEVLTKQKDSFASDDYIYFGTKTPSTTNCWAVTVASYDQNGQLEGINRLSDYKDKGGHILCTKVYGSISVGAHTYVLHHNEKELARKTINVYDCRSPSTPKDLPACQPEITMNLFLISPKKFESWEEIRKTATSIKTYAYPENPKGFGFDLGFKRARFVQAKLVLTEKKSGQTVMNSEWDKSEGERVSYGLIYRTEFYGNLTPATYEARLYTRTVENGEYQLLYTEEFVITGPETPVKNGGNNFSLLPDKPDPERSKNKERSKGPNQNEHGLGFSEQLAEIGGLKEALQLKIEEAKRIQELFEKEMDQLLAESKKGMEMSERRQARIGRDLERKQEYLVFIKDKKAKFEDGLETLYEVESEIEDRNKISPLNDKGLEQKARATINNTIKLLRQTLIDEDKPKPKTRR